MLKVTDVITYIWRLFSRRQVMPDEEDPELGIMTGIDGTNPRCGCTICPMHSQKISNTAIEMMQLNMAALNGFNRQLVQQVEDQNGSCGNCCTQSGEMDQRVVDILKVLEANLSKDSTHATQHQIEAMQRVILEELRKYDTNNSMDMDRLAQRILEKVTQDNDIALDRECRAKIVNELSDVIHHNTERVIDKIDTTKGPTTVHIQDDAKVQIGSENIMHVGANQNDDTCKFIELAIITDNSEILRAMPQMFKDETKSLLEQGNLSDGMCSLHLAAKTDKIDIIKVLLELGVDVDIKARNGDTPIQIAVREGKIEALKLLHQHNADINIIEPTSKCNLLHIAAMKGNIEVVIYVNENIDKGIHETPCCSPLLFAAQQGHTEVCKYLVENEHSVLEKCRESCPSSKIYKMNPTKRRRNFLRNQTPLHLAAEGGHEETVAYFLGIDGIDVNCRDELGRTPLHYAVVCNSPNTAQLLMAKGADCGTLNSNNKSPLDIATGNPDMMAILLGQ